MQLVRNGLCHGVALGVAHVQDASDVADRAARRHRAEGDDLGDLVLAVLAGHVVDHLAAPLLAEVGVEVGHGDALRVQKALEDQGILHRINFRNVHAVGADRGRAGAASRTDGNALLLGPADKVRHDQIVVHVAHPLDDAHLVVQTVTVFLRRVGIALCEALAAQPPEIGQRIGPVRGVEGGQMVVVEFKFDAAASGDPGRVFKCLVKLREALAELGLGFHVELVGLKAHPVRLVHGFPGLDTHQDVLHHGVLSAQIVAVVRHHQRQLQLPRQAEQEGIDLGLLGNAVILELQIEAVRSEDRAVFPGDLLRSLVVVDLEPAGDGARQTGRQGDQTLRMGPQQIHVDPGPPVKALQKAHGDHVAQIPVAGLVFTEENQVGALPVHAVNLVKAGTRGHVDLAADDGLHPGSLRRLVEVDHAVHDAVIRDRNGVLAQLLDPVHQPPDPARAVQQAVFRMQMQMDEGHGYSFPSSQSLRSRWFRADLVSGGSNRAASSARLDSGFSVRRRAVSFSFSGRASSSPRASRRWIAAI